MTSITFNFNISPIEHYNKYSYLYEVFPSKYVNLYLDEYINFYKSNENNIYALYYLELAIIISKQKKYSICKNFYDI